MNQHTPGPCTIPGCTWTTVPGLAKCCGKCAFHWAKGNWGIAWAAKCHPQHPEARAAIAKAEGKV